MARKFSKGDTVSYIGKNTGLTYVCEVDGYATNGMVALTIISGGHMVSRWESELTLVEKAQPKPAPVQAKRPAVYRWVCLECGKKHNSRVCPECGSDERIHNTDADTDPSILLGGTPAEPYTPRDDA